MKVQCMVCKQLRKCIPGETGKPICLRCRVAYGVQPSAWISAKYSRRGRYVR
jgi:hypothetical protein